MHDLAFNPESPNFSASFDTHRNELGLAEEHLRSLTQCSAALAGRGATAHRRAFRRAKQQRRDWILERWRRQWTNWADIDRLYGQPEYVAPDNASTNQANEEVNKARAANRPIRKR